MDTDPCWSLVLPVKPLRLAKSRLALPPGLRADVVLAMAADTIAAARACPRVARVLVVTDDPRARPVLAGLGAEVVADVPDAGLNAALAYGAALAADSRPGCGVATLSADLPAVRPDELATVLDAAARHPRAMLPDSDGTGTTLLAAAPGLALDPAYGPGSRDRHVAAGHVPLDVAGVAGARRDVDTLDDLNAAAALGTGPHTRALLHRVADATARLR